MGRRRLEASGDFHEASRAAEPEGSEPIWPTAAAVSGAIAWRCDLEAEARIDALSREASPVPEITPAVPVAPAVAPAMT